MLRHIAALVVTILATSCTTEPVKPSACQDTGNFVPTDRSYTASELEAIGMAGAKRNPTVPQVPFAYGNSQWTELKSMARPGDIFRAFDNPDVGDDPSGALPDGILLMRGDCVIGLMGLRQA